jgi:hypothetical protein
MVLAKIPENHSDVPFVRECFILADMGLIPYLLRRSLNSLLTGVIVDYSGLQSLRSPAGWSRPVNSPRSRCVTSR